VRHIPATFEGRARVNVKNALAAVAASYVSEVSLETIRNGLRSFSTSFYQAPGRLNLLDMGSYRVIVDYCHNPAGMEELSEFVRRMMPSHTTAVIAMPGDRRNEDIAIFGSIAARTFDDFIVREDRNLRGRRPGEVASLMRRALVENGVPEHRVTLIYDELEAAKAAMDRAKQDDLVVLLADRPEEVWETVVARGAQQQQLVQV
jgi:cyanophycin synthetase